MEQLGGGDELQDEFERAGFGDFFYSPNQPEWSELCRSKLPNLTGNGVPKLPLDTLYSLLADADFDKLSGRNGREKSLRGCPFSRTRSWS